VAKRRRTVTAPPDEPAKNRRKTAKRAPNPAKRRRTRARRPHRETAPRKVAAPPPKQRRTRLRSGSPRRRLIIALVVIGLILLTIIVRLGMIQTAGSDSLRSAGVEQWTRTYDISARRGTIFDRNGSELAMSIPSATISLNPKLVENGEATIQLLDDLLDLSDDKVDELTSEVLSKERGFVYVARQVDDEVGEQVASLELPGVSVQDDNRRELTGGLSARSVIGSVDIDGVGTAGLELQYDDLLAGSGGQMRREIAPGGRTIPGSDSVTEQPVAGDDLVLTIDRSIQHTAEQLLLERVGEIPARGAQSIVMDTDSGEILAMASVRRDERGVPEITSGNYALVEAYEPGSVAKVVTIAGALDSGAVTPETGFEVPWRREYFDVVLSDSHQHATEWMDVWKILVVSSNIGTIEIQREMGSELHHEYMQAFGWGESTGLDFPQESSGDLKPYEDMWGSEKLTPAYGQGVATTPAQLVAMVNTIGNGGTYVAPKLLKSTIDPEGEVTDLPPSETRRVVSEEAAQQTSDIMRDVVCRGTAKRAQVDGLTIAGKTGTGFKASDNGTYWTDEGTRQYYASFVGYFPAEDPQVTVLVSVDEPAATNERFGGTAAAPVFAEMAPLLLNELGIQPPVGSGCSED
jgi:cell division protein FtsI (penicillin-binding protein 3)